MIMQMCFTGIIILQPEGLVLASLGFTIEDLSYGRHLSLSGVCIEGLFLRLKVNGLYLVVLFLCVSIPEQKILKVLR